VNETLIGLFHVTIPSFGWTEENDDNL